MDADRKAADIAAAIGEPARARMLYSLLDGRARTATELAILAEVSPSTATAHLQRLREKRLTKVHAQGKHRYFALENPDVARALEALSVLAGPRKPFVPNTPNALRAARTCYDHIAGTLGVALHDHFLKSKWLTDGYAITAAGNTAFASLGIDPAALQTQRRKFAAPCLDWSERRPHLTGSLAAEILKAFLKKRWLAQDLTSRALEITSEGRRGLKTIVGPAI